MNHISIYQIYYKQDQESFLEEAFKPYNNISNENPEWHEYWIFYQNYKKYPIQESEYRGYLSWKFRQKTQVHGENFKNFILQNPGYDVYFINPFYMNAFLFQNVWYQAEYYHPGIMKFVQNLFYKLNYEVDIYKIVNTEDNTLFCNYWIGNQRFWKSFMDFTVPIYNYINNSLTKEEGEFIHSRADKQINASYIAFIMERMFSTLMVFNKDISSLSYHKINRVISPKDKAAYFVFKNLEIVKALEIKNLNDDKSIQNLSIAFRETVREYFFKINEKIQFISKFIYKLRILLLGFRLRLKSKKYLKIKGN
ncbi:MAG: hypothetical protein H7A23_08690 [Leptospiraceae bacterium]|nr:hypothetical protein [Leptospiraceae bacterium]MCP5494622.1 hypothetical protein [Leptospiraceae bacterium]